jgi:hypothetical protein
MADSLETLKGAGIAVDQIPGEQREVLASLSEEEAKVLASVQQRLNSAGGEEVEGYLARQKDTGYIIY